LAALVQAEKKAVSMDMLAYINRLSDLFFVLARLSNAQAGVTDVPWKKS
jgi:cob(I)alamin adenosyltransferase